jgi:alanine racemase
MDSMMVDVTDIPDARVGSEAVIYGQFSGGEVRPETVAQWAGTTAYELVARLGPRVQRIFIGA